MSFLIHERVVKDACQFIRDHLHLSLSVTDLAQHYGYSRKQFTRIFNEVMGVFPSVYIKSIKVDQAKKWLKDSEMSINEIACRLGYTYQNHF
ncbi:MAG TPA: AraC family transcriptional regulator, partial [Bacilli bacterium]